jgi:copper resistance protein B
MNNILKTSGRVVASTALLVSVMQPHSGMAQTTMSGQMSTMPGMEMPATGTTSPDKSMNGVEGMDHSDKPMKNMPGMQGKAASPAGDMSDMKMDDMQQMDMSGMQGGKAPPNARDPDAYAEGLSNGPMPGMDMADDQSFGRLLVNELEYTNSSSDHGQRLDMEAWYGGDLNKVWFKAEGERRNGALEEARTEVLWDRNIATYWSSQLGLRHDNGSGGSKNWLAVGVQGLAPYWFETEATAYVGSGGALAARLEARYELLFTQRLILEPKIETNLYSKNDADRDIGSGLSDVSVGLRLRYEISRQFAPYVGVSWKRKYGNTADYARDAGEDVSNTEVVAGVRMWF